VACQVADHDGGGEEAAAIICECKDHFLLVDEQTLSASAPKQNK